METIGDRVRKARRAKKMSQQRLAEIVGLRQASISDLEQGKTKGTPSIAKIASALGVNAMWLETGRGDISQQHFDNNVSPVEIESGFVPLVSWVKAGNWETPLDDRDNYDMVHCPIKECSANTFALSVRGISMDDPNNPKSFQEGDIIFVDPERQAVSGSFVIAMHNDNYEATFKQLFMEDNKKFLRALNPNWEPRIQEITTDTYICGVVIARIKTTIYK